MMELINNPVTIIAGLLALFFLAMGLGRRWIERRDQRQVPPGEEQKPQEITDPYRVPPPDAVPAAPEPAQTVTVPGLSGTRYFKEFGSAAESVRSQPDHDGYVWE